MVVTLAQIKKIIELLELKGVDLNDLPLCFVEDQIAQPLLKKYINVVNVDKFNANEDLKINLQNYKNCIIIGPLMTVD